MSAEPEQIESPCIRNCCLDENDICLGCFRSISEITSWGMVNDQKRKKILRETELRRKARELEYKS